MLSIRTSFMTQPPGRYTYCQSKARYSWIIFRKISPYNLLRRPVCEVVLGGFDPSMQLICSLPGDPCRRRDPGAAGAGGAAQVLRGDGGEQEAGARAQPQHRRGRRHGRRLQGRRPLRRVQGQKISCIPLSDLQGDPSGWLQPPVDLVPALQEADGPLL